MDNPLQKALSRRESILSTPTKEKWMTLSIDIKFKYYFS